jgi:inorganic triphosphatase YgiF
LATETELKLLTSPEALRKVPTLAAVRSRKAGRASTRQLVTRYFDTPDGLLRRAGMALRLRRAGGRWLQAVKSRGGSVAGMQSRGEWEVPVPDEALSLEAFKATPAFKVLGARGFRAVTAVFETDFSRTLIPLAFPDGSTAELCLDQGRIMSGRRSAPLCEIELELKQGRALRLFELADELAQAVPLRVGRDSKAERGQALAVHGAPRPVKAGPSRIERGMQPAEALLAIVQDCADHLLANEAGVLAGRDIEFLHQARVALRRLRSAMAVFDHAVQLQLPPPVAGLIAEAGNILGAARDWDVFKLETLQPFVAAFPGDAGVAILARRAARQRSGHARAAREFLSSERYVRGMLGLGRFLSAPATSAPYPQQAAPRLVEDAAQILQAAHRRVRRKGRQLQAHLHGGEGAAGMEAIPYPELHRLRIRAKKLRYAAEFFEPLFAGQRPRAYIRSLADLQDALGGLNDCVTAERLLGELVPADAKPEPDPELRRALARAEGWLAARRARHLGDVPGAWARFNEHGRFWKKHLPEPPAPEPAPIEPQVSPESGVPAGGTAADSANGPDQ